MEVNHGPLFFILLLSTLLFPCDSAPEFKKPVERLVEKINIFRTPSPELIPVQRLVEREISWKPDEPESIHILGENDQPDVGQYAGYFKLNRTHDARMFYWFFESRGNKSEDPVVLWMTGGPGCASELALFYENGPWKINADQSSLTWNPYGWDKVSNLIYIDQPVGTGFSYSEDPRDTRHDEDGISQDVFEFLQEFFIAHPDYADHDFFVTGESYGGHYVPAVSSRIHTGNKKKEGLYIPLKGFAIGNGLTEPSIQYASYADFALENKLISQTVYTKFMKVYPLCSAAIRACGTKGKLPCAAAFVVCNTYFQNLFAHCGTGNLNVYDIRSNCTFEPLCYDFSPLSNYLGQESVKSALGVSGIEFQECNTGVYEAMILDFMRNSEPMIPPLLEDGIRALIYAGEKDMICNWLGNSRWVEALPWSGHSEYLAAPTSTFKVAGADKGISKNFGPLTFLKVGDAGHMVPMDQPEAALEMLVRFLKDEPFGSPDSASEIVLTI